jgi:hypothetical protein
MPVFFKPENVIIRLNDTLLMLNISDNKFIWCSFRFICFELILGIILATYLLVKFIRYLSKRTKQDEMKRDEI